MTALNRSYRRFRVVAANQYSERGVVTLVRFKDGTYEKVTPREFEALQEANSAALRGK